MLPFEAAGLVLYRVISFSVPRPIFGSKLVDVQAALAPLLLCLIPLMAVAALNVLL